MASLLLLLQRLLPLGRHSTWLLWSAPAMPASTGTERIDAFSFACVLKKYILPQAYDTDVSKHKLTAVQRSVLC